MNQGQAQTGNSRNQVLKSGIGARLNTKNTNNNLVTGGSIGGGRVNTHSSFSGNNAGVVSANALKQSMNKSIQLNTNFYNNGNGGQTSSNGRVASGKHAGAASGSNAHQSNSQKLNKKKAQNLSSSQ
jgi:hypothetical protein